MNKQEFVKKMDKAIQKASNGSSDFFTCFYIRKNLHIKASKKYQKLIGSFLNDLEMIDSKFNDINNSRQTIRVLLLSTFKIECLESGIYKEF